MMTQGCSQPKGPQIISSQSLRTIQQYKNVVKTCNSTVKRKYLCSVF